MGGTLGRLVGPTSRAAAAVVGAAGGANRGRKTALRILS